MRDSSNKKPFDFSPEFQLISDVLKSSCNKNPRDVNENVDIWGDLIDINAAYDKAMEMLNKGDILCVK